MTNQPDHSYYRGPNVTIEHDRTDVCIHTLQSGTRVIDITIPSNPDYPSIRFFIGDEGGVVSVAAEDLHDHNIAHLATASKEA